VRQRRGDGRCGHQDRRRQAVQSGRGRRRNSRCGRCDDPGRCLLPPDRRLARPAVDDGAS
jgi:hypothetical protein